VAIKPNKEIETKVLALILRSGELGKYLEELDSRYFTFPETKLLFRFIKYHYQKYRVPLKEDLLKQYLDKYPTASVEEKTDCFLLMVKLSTMEVEEKDLKFLLDELREVNTYKETTKLLDEATTDLLEGHIQQALTKMEVGLLKIRKSELTEIRRREVWESAEQRKLRYLDIKEHPEKYKGVLFGLKKLDELTNGIQPGEFGVVFARTGAGKSRFLFTLSYNAVQAGKTVLYISLEMSLEQLERIYDSRQGMLGYDQIKKGALDYEEEVRYFRQLDELKKNKDHFYIVDVPRGCTALAIESEIDNYERIYQRKPDLVIVDYLALMKPIGEYFNASDKYGNITRELRELIRAKKMAGFSAVQSTRTSLEATKIGTEHIAWSDAVGQHCDMVLHIHLQSDEEKAQNILKGTLVKYRDGANIDMDWYVDWAKNYISDFESQPVETDI
jgi:replicative DNA helicase